MFLYHKGQLGPAHAFKIPFLERLFIGDGIFRTLKVQEGKICYLEDHLDQLKRDCVLLRVAVPSVAEETLKEFVIRSQAHKGTWRLKIMVAALTKRTQGIAESEFFLTLQPYDQPKQELRLLKYPHPKGSSLATIKTFSYLEYDLASTFAQERGFDDALLLNSKGQILECGKANLIWFYESCMFFIDPQLRYYQGVMQGLCLKAAQSLKLTPVPSRITVSKIPSQAILFAINSLQGPLPVIQIGNKSYPRCQHLEIQLKEALANFI